MVKGRSIGKATDYWSLGIIFFNMFAEDYFKRGVFRAFDRNNSEATMREDILNSEPRLAGIKNDSKETVSKLLQKELALRLNSLHEMRKEKMFKLVDWRSIESRSCRPPATTGLNESRKKPRGEIIFDDFDWCAPEIHKQLIGLLVENVPALKCDTATQTKDDARKKISLDDYVMKQKLSTCAPRMTSDASTDTIDFQQADNIPAHIVPADGDIFIEDEDQMIIDNPLFIRDMLPLLNENVPDVSLPTNENITLDIMRFITSKTSWKDGFELKVQQEDGKTTAVFFKCPVCEVPKYSREKKKTKGLHSRGLIKIKIRKTNFSICNVQRHFKSTHRSLMIPKASEGETTLVEN